MFLLVPAYPGCPGPKADKRLCVCVFWKYLAMNWEMSLTLPLPLGDLDHHEIHGSFGPPKYTFHMASRLVQPL